MMMRGGLGSVCAVDDYQEGQGHWDDISGKALGQEGVNKARQDDMEEFRKHGVYEHMFL